MEFVAYAKAHPGKLTLASPGTGSTPHLAGELLKQMAGIEMTHVPYRGASPALNDLIPGRVDCYFGSGALLENMRSGQLRGLAVTSAKRDPVAPELPTMAEAGQFARRPAARRRPRPDAEIVFAFTKVATRSVYPSGGALTTMKNRKREICTSGSVTFRVTRCRRGTACSCRPRRRLKSSGK
jgi:hypothetical protein